MPADDLVYGIMAGENAGSGEFPAQFARQLSICWCRYGYRGPILEAGDLDALLDRARGMGAHWLLVLGYGTLIRERWDPHAGHGTDFNAGLLQWAAASGVARSRSPARQAWLFQLDAGTRDGIEAAASGVSWEPFPEYLEQQMLALDLPTLDWLSRLREGGGGTGAAPADESAEPELQAFCKAVYRQVLSAPRGVFLWNIEPYDDIEPPARLEQTHLDALYSVCAGFKPMWILDTFGMQAHTRVVYFDYSVPALTIRRELVNSWDGTDYPAFVHRLFEKYPHPETFYQLWSDLSPQQIGPRALDDMWSDELARWGGARRFQACWERYRQLHHEYVHCNLLDGAPELIRRMDGRGCSAIWFSNAFFTMFGNVLYPHARRREIYESWMGKLAEINPDVILYGSDYNNDNVNCLAAGDYWRRYREHPPTELRPAGLNLHQIRM